MRVLVIGATGLIGAGVVARLLARGDAVTGIARDIEEAARRTPMVRWQALDIARARKAEDWPPCLEGVEAVVNCAGVLQDSPRDSTVGVHADGPDALYAACEAAGIRRVVHISAIGVDRATPTAFSRSKRLGDERLMARQLDWVILRPSVVLGRQAYGASALIRGLAALPVLPVMPETAEIAPVQLDNLTATVLAFLAPEAPSRVVVELPGPEHLTFDALVLTYRRWLGWPAPHMLRLPRRLAGLLYALGDAASRLGWRPPLRSTARREIARGATGDGEPWRGLTGIAPRRVAEALAAEPASVQERWFASLYMIKPLLFTVFALFWIVTGLLSIGPGYPIGVALMEEGGAGALSGPAVIAGGLADLAIGIGIAFRRTARVALYAALLISLFYAAAGTIVLPRLWIEPLGPLTKIWPIMVLNLVAIAILRDR